MSFQKIPANIHEPVYRGILEKLIEISARTTSDTHWIYRFSFIPLSDCVVINSSVVTCNDHAPRTMGEFPWDNCEQKIVIEFPVVFCNQFKSIFSGFLCSSFPLLRSDWWFNSFRVSPAPDIMISSIGTRTLFKYYFITQTVCLLNFRDENVIIILENTRRKLDARETGKLIDCTTKLDPKLFLSSSLMDVPTEVPTKHATLSEINYGSYSACFEAFN